MKQSKDYKDILLPETKEEARQVLEELSDSGIIEIARIAAAILMLEEGGMSDCKHDRCKSKGEGGDLCPIVIQQAVKITKLQATIEKQRELMQAVVDNSYLDNYLRVAKHAQFDAMAEYLEKGE